MPDSLTCEDVSSRDLVPQYVSGVVSEMDAEALELHVLGCERCWAELQAARDVRAALLEPTSRREDALIAGGSSRSHGRKWLPLVAAAVVLLAAAGAWETWHTPPTVPEVTRGEGVLSITGHWMSEGGLRLEWPARNGAVVYHVRVTGSSARPVEKRVTLPAATFLRSELSPVGQLTVEVQAENAVGEVIAHGSTILPSRP